MDILYKKKEALKKLENGDKESLYVFFEVWLKVLKFFSI